MVRFEQFLALI